MVSNLFFHSVSGQWKNRLSFKKKPKLGLPVDDIGVLPEHYFRYPINWDRCPRNMAHAKIYLVIFPFLLAANHSTQGE